ncbi:MAG: Gfo/Idh/MocA family oxidoreductase [Spirochaetales bacterium]|nr:Gfo/Idh/MocA family oxidoreductase [Spirochaetales bacterium]
MKRIGVGIIGTGERGCFILGARLAELAAETGFRLEALCDALPARLREAEGFLVQSFAAAGESVHPALYADYRDLINDGRVDFIIITTHTYTHREVAVAALESGKRVYLDKPISVSLDDARAIRDAEQRTGNTLIMGFTRRYELSWRTARDILLSGEIGELQMMQIRSLIPYTRYFQLWHRRKQWSGGALNDKSSHHFDVMNWMTGSMPVRLTAMGGRSSIFSPDPDAPPYCAVCDRDCPYRRLPSQGESREGGHILRYPSWSEATEEINRADTCVYRPGADIEDHAIVSVEYANGVQASLFWAIYGPEADDQETLELLGSAGRIVLTRSSGELSVISDYGRSRRVFFAGGDDFNSSHYGADKALLREMRGFYDGGHPVASSFDGYESLRMVLAAEQSMAAGALPVDLRLDVAEPALTAEASA